MQRRFDSHLKDYVIEIQKNIFVDPHDPAYFEKMMKYMGSQQRPEYHLKLARKWEQQGYYGKAFFHYLEIMRTRSPYYEEARSALRRLEGQLFMSPNPVKRKKIVKKDDAWIWVFILSCLFIVAVVVGLWMINVHKLYQ